MKHCSLFCAGIWPFLLFPLLVLLPLLYFCWHAIERDIADNATTALAPEQNWAKAETFNNGRDVLLSGTAPDADSITQAEQLVEQANGVRTAGFIGNLASPNPASVEMRNSSGRLVLAGTMANQSEVDDLVNSAVAKHGPDNISNELKVGNNIASFDSASDLLIATDLLPEGALVSVLGEELSLRGSVQSQSTKIALQNQLASVFSGKINNLMTVLPPPIVKNDICQELLNQLLESAKINFESGNASIQEDSKPLIQNIAATAKRCPEAEFEVAGHTDSKGALAFNTNLSQQRAVAVVEALLELGLSADRFTARGYGPTQAIADNATAEGRAANRRIEFRINNQVDLETKP